MFTFVVVIFLELVMYNLISSAMKKTYKNILVNTQADHPLFVWYTCNDCFQLETLYSRDMIG